MAGGGAEAKAVGKAAEGVVAKAVGASVRDAEKVVARDAARGAEKQVGRDVERGLAPEVRDTLGRTFDNAHPGPLTPGEAGTFTDGRYTVGVTHDAQNFYRAGDATAPHDPHLGQYFTDTPPESVEAVRRESAVKEVWTDADGKVTGRSPLNTGYEVQFPPGTVYYYGEVASQGGRYTGGGMQYYIRRPWEMDPKPPKISEWPLKP
jgi:hypothetical protein